MPFAICRKRCFDGNLGRLYYTGDVVEDMSFKHPLAGSFEFKKVPSPVIEKIEEVEEKEEKEEEVIDEDKKEVKRGPGRPKKE